MKNRYKISVVGCDDTTIFVMDLTEEEFKLIKLVADTCTETSEYGCMPIMNIEKEDDLDDI